MRSIRRRERLLSDYIVIYDWTMYEDTTIIDTWATIFGSIWQELLNTENVIITVRDLTTRPHFQLNDRGCILKLDRDMVYVYTTDSRSPKMFTSMADPECINKLKRTIEAWLAENKWILDTNWLGFQQS